MHPSAWGTNSDVLVWEREKEKKERLYNVSGMLEGDFAGTV